MYDDLIVAATAKHGLPVGLLSALIQLAAYNQGPTVISRALHYAEAVEALV